MGGMATMGGVFLVGRTARQAAFHIVCQRRLQAPAAPWTPPLAPLGSRSAALVGAPPSKAPTKAPIPPRLPSRPFFCVLEIRWNYMRLRAAPSHCRPRASRVIKAHRVTANQRPKVPKARQRTRVTANRARAGRFVALALEVKLRKKRHVVGREDRRGQRRVLLHQSLVRHLEQPPHR